MTISIGFGLMIIGICILLAVIIPILIEVLAIFACLLVALSLISVVMILAFGLWFLGIVRNTMTNEFIYDDWNECYYLCRVFINFNGDFQ